MTNKRGERAVEITITSETATNYLNYLVGESLCYGIKSPGLNLYDFGFGNLGEATEGCKYSLHIICRFKIIWKRKDRRIEKYDGETSPEEFQTKINPLLNLKVKSVVLGNKNNLHLDMGDYRIVFFTWKEEEESWRFLSFNEERYHIYASDQDIYLIN